MSTEASERWQTRTVEQLTTASNLIFTLSLGGLVFTTDKILDGKMILSKEEFKLYAVYGASFITALIFGFLLVVNRLLDFKETAQIAKLHKRNSHDPSLEVKRQKARKRGERTWLYFAVQLGSFSFGVGWYFILLGLQVYRLACSAH